MNSKIKFLSFLLLTVSFPSLYAQQFASEKFKTLSVETVLVYSVKEYLPAYKLPDIATQIASDFSTPENVLATFFGSLRSANYIWNESCWTRESKEFNRRKNIEAGLTPLDWEKRWKSQYGDKKIELINRIEYEKYVIIEFKAIHIPSASVSEQDTLVFEKEDGKWLLTQALSNNPITFAWKASNGRIQVGPNTVGQLSKKAANK